MLLGFLVSLVVCLVVVLVVVLLVGGLVVLLEPACGCKSLLLRLLLLVMLC